MFDFRVSDKADNLLSMFAKVPTHRLAKQLVDKLDESEQIFAT